MKNVKLFVSCAALSLLLVACGAKESSEPAKSTSASAAPSSQQPSKTSSVAPSSTSSAAPKTPTPDATQALVTQESTPTEGGAGETITWNAQDANKDASSGFDSNGKFKATGDYVQYTFNATMKMQARLYVEMSPRNGSSDSAYNRETKTGNQSIWYDYYNGPDWKYAVTVNSIDVDQDAMAKYKVNAEDVDMKELMYEDFLAAGDSTLFAPWFEFEVLAGRNTIRIERSQGYSVSMKSFKVLGLRVAN